MVKDPYEILGVSQGASMDEIKRAYRRKAKEYHPDLHPDDPRANERMQQINEAYDMLCNPEKYRGRPQPGADWRQANYGGQAGGPQYQNGGWWYTGAGSAGQNGWQEWPNGWRVWQQQQPPEPRQRYGMTAHGMFRAVIRLMLFLLLARFFLPYLGFLFFGFFL